MWRVGACSCMNHREYCGQQSCTWYVLLFILIAFFFGMTGNNRVVELLRPFAWHLFQLLRPWLCVQQTTQLAQHLAPLALTGFMVTYTSDVANDSAALCFTQEEITQMPALPGKSGSLINAHACSVLKCTAKWVEVFFFYYFLFFYSYGCLSTAPVVQSFLKWCACCVFGKGMALTFITFYYFIYFLLKRL